MQPSWEHRWFFSRFPLFWVNFVKCGYARFLLCSNLPPHNSMEMKWCNFKWNLTSKEKKLFLFWILNQSTHTHNIMKFAEHLSVHTTPEWRAAYINYEVFNLDFHIVFVSIFFRWPNKRIAFSFSFSFSLESDFHWNVIRMKIPWFEVKKVRMRSIRRGFVMVTVVHVCMDVCTYGSTYGYSHCHV